MVAPWAVTLTPAEHSLIVYFLIVAGLVFLFGLLRTWATGREVGARYRVAVTARLGVMGVAFASYLFLTVAFLNGYDRVGSGFRPNSGAMLAFTGRYMEWSVTVPLLVVELLAVCTLIGQANRKTLGIAAAGGFLMIFTGYLGNAVTDGELSIQQLIVWGGLSCVFWIATTVVLVLTVRRSMPELTAEAAGLLRNATWVLLGGWVIYPLVYAIQIVAIGGQWTTTMQIVYTVSDVTVKLGFAGLIHRIAKLRTAEDVRAGDDVHPEAIWIDSVKQSDAGLPVVVYLAEGAIINASRPKPPGGTAAASHPEASPGIDESSAAQDSLEL